MKIGTWKSASIYRPLRLVHERDKFFVEDHATPSQSWRKHRFSRTTSESKSALACWQQLKIELATKVTFEEARPEGSRPAPKSSGSNAAT